MGEVLAGALVDRDVWSQGAARQKAQLDLQLARQALREAAITLQELLFRLNARPGRGMDFSLVRHIASTEKWIFEAELVFDRLRKE